jgi:hypothetical protein
MAKKNGSNSVVNLGNASTEFYRRLIGAKVGSKTGTRGTGQGGGLLGAAKGSASIKKILIN